MKKELSSIRATGAAESAGYIWIYNHNQNACRAIYSGNVRIAYGIFSSTSTELLASYMGSVISSHTSGSWTQSPANGVFGTVNGDNELTTCSFIYATA